VRKREKELRKLYYLRLFNNDLMPLISAVRSLFFFPKESQMSNAIEVMESRKWVRNGRVLVELTGDTVQIPAMSLAVEEQAAVCFVLLSRLCDRCGIAPFAVGPAEVEHVLDSLSSIAEFPSLNQV
jgi:hypothetical protein